MRDANTAFANAVVDEWARAGVTHAVVAPGSRSTPLALALARDHRICVHVVVDERSAAFRSLGIARGSGRPAVVCCTSGTAAANFHPAVVEAHHGRVPLVVATADRPPELRDTGAGQTIDQSHLYGRVVRWFADPGPPEDRPDAGAVWRSFASRAVAEAAGPPAGPVHCNLPFREPLVPTGAPLVEAPGRPGGVPWTVSHRARRAPDDATVAQLAALVRTNPRGVLVAGWGTGAPAATIERFAAAAGWPVLADAVSGVRAGPHAVSTYDALLRARSFAAAQTPTLALQVGAPLTSKVANAWLDAVPTILVDPDGVWLDPTRRAGHRVEADEAALLAAVADALGAPAADRWFEAWRAAEARARAALDCALDEPGAVCEALVARDLSAMLRDGTALVVASSLPVRALEWAMAPRSGVHVFSNRGANGIDGFVSTAIGVADAGWSTVAFAGDLCFLHDTNGLLGADAPVTFVVVDNDGGGIFTYLPQRDLPEFERLFATPTRVDLVDVSRAHGARAERVDDLAAVNEPHDGVRVLVVSADREHSAARHRAMWDAVGQAIDAAE